MAFEKLYKLVTDSPIGYQVVNAIADNAEELRTQMLVEHGTVEPPARGAQGLDYHRLGRHDLPEVPRAVAYAALYLKSVTTIDINMGWTGPGIPFISKVGTGSYMIPVVGLSRFWAKITPSLGGVLTLLEPRVRTFYAGTVAASGFVNLYSGLRIDTFALVAGNFVPFEMNLGIALYGTP